MSKLAEYEVLISEHLNRILQLDLHDLNQYFEAFSELNEVIMVAGEEEMFEEGFGVGDCVLDALIKIVTSDTFYNRTQEDHEVWNVYQPIVHCLTIISSNFPATSIFSIDKLKIFVLSLLAFIKSGGNVDLLEATVSLLASIVLGKPECFKHEILLYSNYVVDYFEDSEDIRFFTMIIIGSLGTPLNALDLAHTDVDFALTLEVILKYITNRGYDDEETNYLYALKLMGDLLRVLCQISSPDFDKHKYSDDLKTEVTDTFINAILTRFLAILQHQDLNFAQTIAATLDNEVKASNGEDVEHITKIETTKGHQLCTTITNLYTLFLEQTQQLPL